MSIPTYSDDTLSRIHLVDCPINWKLSICGLASNIHETRRVEDEERYGSQSATFARQHIHATIFYMYRVVLCWSRNSHWKGRGLGCCRVLWPGEVYLYALHEHSEHYWPFCQANLSAEQIAGLASALNIPVTELHDGLGDIVGQTVGWEHHHPQTRLFISCMKACWYMVN